MANSSSAAVDSPSSLSGLAELGNDLLDIGVAMLAVYGVAKLGRREIAPSTLLSAHAPPTHPRLTIPVRWPLSVKAALMTLIERQVLDRTCGPALNAVRRELGLAPRASELPLLLVTAARPAVGCWPSPRSAPSRPWAPGSSPGTGTVGGSS